MKHKKNDMASLALELLGSPCQLQNSEARDDASGQYDQMRSLRDLVQLQLARMVPSSAWIMTPTYDIKIDMLAPLSKLSQQSQQKTWQKSPR